MERHPHKFKAYKVMKIPTHTYLSTYKKFDRLMIKRKAKEFSI